MEQTIGIIGYGNMGSAIAERLRPEYKLLVFDKDERKTVNLKQIKTASNSADLATRAKVVILAVKPQDFEVVLGEIKGNVNNRLIVSIAAGITTGYIERFLGKVRVVRVMPNLPAKIGKGMICLCRGRFASDDDLGFAKRLFDNLGKTMFIEEGMMNAATAVSGSGPGYFYDLIQDKQEKEQGKYAEEFIWQLSKSAQAVGFDTQQAQVLAEATTSGAVALLKEVKVSAKELCGQVTSKGGTTEAGLKALHSTHSLEEAVKAALKRAEELSRH